MHKRDALIVFILQLPVMMYLLTLLYLTPEEIEAVGDFHSFHQASSCLITAMLDNIVNAEPMNSLFNDKIPTCRLAVFTVSFRKARKRQ